MNERKKMTVREKTKGVTILEIILVLAVLMIVSTLTLQGLSSYRYSQALSSETTQVLSFLNKARTETLSSKEDQGYGVRINGDRIILFPGLVFSSSTPGNEEHILNSSIEISNLSLAGGGLDIIFERLTGESQNYGTFRLILQSDPLQYRIISVKQTGFISVE